MRCTMLIATSILFYSNILVVNGLTSHKESKGLVMQLSKMIID